MDSDGTFALDASTTEAVRPTPSDRDGWNGGTAPTDARRQAMEWCVDVNDCSGSGVDTREDTT